MSIPNHAAVITLTVQFVLSRSQHRTRLSAGGGTNREFEPHIYQSLIFSRASDSVLTESNLRIARCSDEHIK